MDEGLRNRILENKAKNAEQRYHESPKCSMIIQSFNKKANLPLIIERLRSSKLVQEIIVIDDGSIDGTYEILPGLLNQPNDFLIRSNDLYEVKMYDRAIRMSRAEFICLLQDDDIPPTDGQWISQAITLFEEYPKLLILGGNQGISFTNIEEHDFGYLAHSQPDFRDLKWNIQVEFVHAINRAPMFLRRSEFIANGGIDEVFAPWGGDDSDVCLRAWRNNFQVAFFYARGFIRDVGVGGIRLYNEYPEAVDSSGPKRPRASAYAQVLINRFGEFIKSGDLQRLCFDANASLSRFQDSVKVSSSYVAFAGSFNLAVRLYNLGDYRGCFAALQRAEALMNEKNHRMVNFYTLFGLTMLNLGYPEQALLYLRNETILFPENALPTQQIDAILKMVGK